jgi:DNA-binding transcriptional LysR family regulator
LDTELLRTFLEVRNTRHFGRAADNLFISAAAVSARIKQLEELLGVSLFVRERNNIQLSAEGERLVPHAETVLLAWARARQELVSTASADAQLSLSVRFGLWGPALQARLMPLPADLSATLLRLETQAGDVLIRRLLDRTIDLGLSYEAPALPELRFRLVGRLELHLCGLGGRFRAVSRQVLRRPRCPGAAHQYQHAGGGLSVSRRWCGVFAGIFGLCSGE